jgi:hypothetical protein
MKVMAQIRPARRGPPWWPTPRGWRPGDGERWATLNDASGYYAGDEPEEACSREEARRRVSAWRRDHPRYKWLSRTVEV